MSVGFDEGVGGCSFLCLVPIIGALRFSGQLGENWKNWRESVLRICHFFCLRLLHYHFVAETVRGKQVGRRTA